jgi:hypothetical protein
MTTEMLPCVVGFQSSGWYLRESGRAMKLAAILTKDWLEHAVKSLLAAAYWVAYEI